MKLSNRASLSLVGNKIYLIEGRIRDKNLIVDRQRQASLNFEKPLAYSDLLELDRLKFRRINLSLDENYFTCHYLVLKNMKEEEIKKYLAEKYREERARQVQYIIGESSYSPYKNLMIVMVPREDIRRIKDLASSQLIGSRTIGINPYNMVKLLNFSSLINGHYKVRDKVIMNVHLSYDYIDSLIFKDLEIRYSSRTESKFLEGYNQEDDLDHRLNHIKNLFHLDLEDEFQLSLASYLDRLKKHMEIIMDYYATQFQQPISYIVLSGELAQLPGIDNILTSSLDKQSLVLRSLDRVGLEEDLGLYAYSLGGLISAREANYV